MSKLDWSRPPVIRCGYEYFPHTHDAKGDWPVRGQVLMNGDEWHDITHRDDGSYRTAPGVQDGLDLINSPMVLERWFAIVYQGGGASFTETLEGLSLDAALAIIELPPIEYHEGQGLEKKE